jgi:hypothetical protein
MQVLHGLGPVRYYVNFNGDARFLKRFCDEPHVACVVFNMQHAQKASFVTTARHQRVPPMAIT